MSLRRKAAGLLLLACMLSAALLTGWLIGVLNEKPSYESIQNALLVISTLPGAMLLLAGGLYAKTRPGYIVSASGLVLMLVAVFVTHQYLLPLYQRKNEPTFWMATKDQCRKIESFAQRNFWGWYPENGMCSTSKRHGGQ